MKRKQNAGLSQLEVLIGLFIMTLIAVLLANVMNFTRLGYNRTAAFKKSGEYILAREDLRTWMSQMPLNAPGVQDGPQFSGTLKSFSFRTWIESGVFNITSPVLVNIRIESIDEQPTLVLEATGRHPIEDREVVLKRPLSSNASNVSIRYYGVLEDDPVPQWRDKWFDTVHLPKLVKMEWDLNDGTAVPPLTLRPAIDEIQRFMSLSSLVPPG